MEESSRTARREFDISSTNVEESLRDYQAFSWLECLKKHKFQLMEVNAGMTGLDGSCKQIARQSGITYGVTCSIVNTISKGEYADVILDSVITEKCETEWCQPMDADCPAMELRNEDISENQPLTSQYQYLGNVRSLLVAVEGLKRLAFEASDLDKDYVDAGTTIKIVDCILSLKSYHEWKQWSDATASILSSSTRGDTWKLEDSAVEPLLEPVLDSKVNTDRNLLASFRGGSKVIDISENQPLSAYQASYNRKHQQSLFLLLENVVKELLPRWSRSEIDIL